MTAVAAPAPVDVRAIPVDWLAPHPANRKRFDKAALAELAESLRTHGQLTPAIVRRIEVAAPDGPTYELLAGERRWRAAKAAGLPTLLCVIRAVDDAAALEILAIENNQREDVHPLEEADLYKALLTVEGYDVATIAAKLHRSVSYVYDRLKLLQLGKAGRTLFLDGVIQVGHAIILARLTKEQQALAIGDEDDWAGRGNGLLEEERTLFHPDQDDDEGTDLPVKAKTPKELQAWVDQHIRCDPTSADLPQLFPETAAALAEAEERKLKTVSITYEHYGQPEAREGGRIIGPRSWKRADGQQGAKACAHQVLGTVAAGPGRGESFLVCLAKDTCAVHWKAEQQAKQRRARARETGGEATTERPKATAAKPLTPAEKKARIARHQAAAADERLEEESCTLPALTLLAHHLQELALSPTHPLVKQAAGRLNSYALSDRDEAKALALVPLGSSAEEMLRRLLWVVFLGEWADEGRYIGGATALLKGLGLTVPQFLALLGAPKLDPKTAWCQRCGCTQVNACPGGCSWDAAHWQAGEAVCTACVPAPAGQAAKGGKRAKATKKKAGATATAEETSWQESGWMDDPGEAGPTVMPGQKGRKAAKAKAGTRRAK